MTEEKNIPEEKDIQSLTLDKKTMDVLVANIIPTSKYFEVRFDHMQDQINRINNDIINFHSDVDKRFEMVNKRFTTVDKRFDDMKIDMDKRFEKVDKRFDDMNVDMDRRFDKMIASIDRLTDKLEDRDNKQRGFTIRMFTISIGISLVGALGAFFKSMGLI